VFCPNCGTQNPDAAEACSKCNFHLKRVSAQKFKGTMLMMNAPGAAGGPTASVPAPPPGPAPAPAPPLPPVGARPVGAVGQPAPAGGGSNKLKGTMVGVAPPMGLMGGVGSPAPAAPVAPATVAHGAHGSAAPTPDMPPGGVGHAADAGSFSPPGQGGVNPLGGTVVASAGPYGVAPGAGTYQGQGLGSATPYAPYASSQGYKTADLPQPPGAMTPYGRPAGGLAPPGAMRSLAVASAGPQQRNALMTWLPPFAVIFGGILLSTLLSLVSMILGSLAYVLFVLAGATWYLILAIQMANELKAVTHTPEFAWWPALVPFYNLYWAWMLVPQEVAKAKQMTGSRVPVRPIALYIFAWHFALASDLNDLAR